MTNSLVIPGPRGPLALARGEEVRIKISTDKAPPPTEKKAAIEEPGWVQLFNGKDLAGWKTHPTQPGN